MVLIMDIHLPQGADIDIPAPQGADMDINLPQGADIDTHRPQGADMDIHRPQGADIDIHRPEGADIDIHIHISTLRTRTEVFETLVFSPFNNLARLIARENFIRLGPRESTRSYTFPSHLKPS
jgi:hypothetical protein